jgi:hypothetical protein
MHLNEQLAINDINPRIFAREIGCYQKGFSQAKKL